MTQLNCPSETWWTDTRTEICNAIDDVFIQLKVGRRTGDQAVVVARHAAPASAWATGVRFDAALDARDRDAPILKPYVEEPVHMAAAEQHVRFAVKVMEDETDFLVVTARIPSNKSAAVRDQLTTALNKQARIARNKLMPRGIRELHWLNGVMASDPRALVAITDETGTIIRISAPLQQLLDRRAGLTVFSGQLRLPTPKATTALSAALAAALNSSAIIGETTAFVPFTLGDPPAPWSIEVQALHRTADLIERVACAREAISYGCLTLRSPDAVQEPSIKAIRQALGLTATEAITLQALMAGQSTEEHAAQRGVTVEAIRFHQKRIYQKTNTRSSLQAAMRAAKLLGVRA